MARFLFTKIGQLPRLSARRFLTTTVRAVAAGEPQSGPNHSTTSQQTTHFGFETVSDEEKQKRVHEVFANVADKYDLMNDVMSAGIHRIWKDIFMERLAPVPGTRLIDVAGGTGDISLRFIKYIENGERNSTNDSSSDSSTDWSSLEFRDEVDSSTLVTVSDINQPMLNICKTRFEKLGYKNTTFLLADAENLPIDDNSYDAYTIAYGIRNCTHIEKVLDEAYRVLKPGGRFMCLEFSHVKNPFLSSIYDLYSFQAIPVIGQVIAGDYRSYQYLVESIRKFPDQETFVAMIENAGFRMVTYENLLFGAAAIHSGFKM